VRPFKTFSVDVIELSVILKEGSRLFQKVSDGPEREAACLQTSHVISKSIPRKGGQQTVRMESQNGGKNTAGEHEGEGRESIIQELSRVCRTRSLSGKRTQKTNLDPGPPLGRLKGIEQGKMFAGKY